MQPLKHTVLPCASCSATKHQEPHHRREPTEGCRVPAPRFSRILFFGTYFPTFTGAICP